MKSYMHCPDCKKRMKRTGKKEVVSRGVDDKPNYKREYECPACGRVLEHKVFASDALKKETVKKEKKELPIMFSACMNSILGAANNRSTKEANIRFEFNELRGHANAIEALCEVIRKGDGVCLKLGPLVVGALAETGERRASDIHTNVNSLETLLKIRPL